MKIEILYIKSKNSEEVIVEGEIMSLHSYFRKEKARRKTERNPKSTITTRKTLRERSSLCFSSTN